MRIGIVNDMRMAQEILRRVVVATPNVAVAWMAQDGEQAVRCCQADTPDVMAAIGAAAVQFALLAPNLRG